MATSQPAHGATLLNGNSGSLGGVASVIYTPTGGQSSRQARSYAVRRR